MTSLLDLLDRIGFWLSRVGAAGTILALVAMMLHICADTLARWLFHSPFTGTLEIVENYYMTSVVFLALALVQRAREHIKVEIFAKLFPKGMLRATDLIASALTAIFCSAFAVAAIQETMRQTEKGTFRDVIFFDMPIWPSYWIMAFGGVLIALATITSFLADLLRPGRDDHHENPEAFL
ncbi:TRAP transporter small permease [Albimonas sp. CAU 1670]|uniref:TRAP transporter small permease n=1 Tax=Albimonas sp. CAU 1670 TaxID=3032599 RepID=UPI0023DCA96D|nr:TRAP transporter small permease [Albimonas sp. CAU 1670]MDF2235005.1 TRAP transporter small permease [Albimonas sp. CAU 1670]